MRVYVSCLLFALVATLLTPSSAEAQVTDAFCTAVYDANGTRVARADGIEMGQVDIFLSDQGRAIRLRAYSTHLLGRANQVSFSEDNCMGDASMFFGVPTPLPYAVLVNNGTVGWSPDVTAAVLPSVDRRSVLTEHSNGLCTNSVETGLQNHVPAFNFTLPTFTPPFHLEPEPCFTPPDPDPEQIINACVKNKGGAMRMVDDPAECTSRETPITLLGQ